MFKYRMQMLAAMPPTKKPFPFFVEGNGIKNRRQNKDTK